MRQPGIIYADHIANKPWPTAGLPDGRWVASRPEPTFWLYPARLRCAWLVFTGRADAIVWTGQ